MLRTLFMAGMVVCTATTAADQRLVGEIPIEKTPCWRLFYGELPMDDADAIDLLAGLRETVQDAHAQESDLLSVIDSLTNTQNRFSGKHSATLHELILQILYHPNVSDVVLSELYSAAHLRIPGGPKIKEFDAQLGRHPVSGVHTQRKLSAGIRVSRLRRR